MKEISENFASTTTFYGVTRIIKAKSRSTKLMWLLMTLLSLLAGLYIIGKTVDDYLQYDVFTMTKRIHPGSNLLPSVTFCSDADLTDISTLVYKSVFTNGTASIGITDETYVEDITFGNSSISNCIKFNNHRSTAADHELLFSKVTAQDILKFNINLNVSFTHLNVFLSDNYLNVLDWSQYVTGFGNIGRGHYYIDFTKSFEHKLPEPFNECQLIADATYRQVNCLDQCKNSKAIADYNFTIKSYFSTPGYAFCEKKRTSEFDSMCEKQCPKECIKIKYDAIISMFEDTGDSNDSLILSVAYTESSYLELSQVPKMNGFSLISNIGGALGLFIGIRFLSIVELLEYLTEIFFVFYRRKITKKINIFLK